MTSGFRLRRAGKRNRHESLALFSRMEKRMALFSWIDIQDRALLGLPWIIFHASMTWIIPVIIPLLQNRQCTAVLQ